MSDVKNEDVEFGKENTSGNNKKKFAIIGAIVAAVIVVVVALIAILGGGYKKPLDNYFKGIQKTNAKTYLKAYPDFAKDKLEDTYDNDYLEKMVSGFEKKYGDKVKISYKVLDKTKIEKDDLKDVKESLEKKYKDEKIKVTEGYEVAVKITVKGSDKKDVTYTSFNVYKINGKWSMLPGSSY